MVLIYLYQELKKKTNIILIVLFEITKYRLKMHSCLEPFLIGPMGPPLR
jgi:hypothetical protein